MTVPADLTYLARRAEREAVLAVLADDAWVAAIHQELSRRYSRELLRGLGEPPEGRVPRDGNIAGLWPTRRSQQE